MAESPQKAIIKVEDFLRALANPRAFVPELSKALRRHGRSFSSKLIRERMRGRPGLIRRTGDLSRSTSSTVTGQSIRELVLLVTIGRGLPYAAVQEFGGIIRPTTRRFLTIPLSSVKTRAGVARFTAREIDDTFVLNLRGNLFVARSFENITAARRLLKRATDIIALGGEQGSGRKTVLLYKLVKSVRIPARLGAIDLFKSKPVEGQRQRLMQNAVDKALRRIDNGS